MNSTNRERNENIAAWDGHKCKAKILIVDDMLMHLETAKLYLEMADYEVFCASNTTSAWQILLQEKIDLIFLDVIMPGQSGLSFLANIKNKFPLAGVIIMTAFGNEDIAARALKTGALDYIKKPLKYSYLSTVVEKALQAQSKLSNQKKSIENLKHAYEKLQVSAESILHCMSAGVVAVDTDIRIHTINQKAKEIMGKKDENVVGEYFYDVFPMYKNYGLLTYTLENKESLKMYEVNIEVEGMLKVISINTDAIYDSQGNQIGAVATFEDMTELRRKEEMLRERERLAIIGQMAAGMAHEIKNPLTAIKGFAQLLGSKAKDHEISGYLDVINSEINRMTEVLQDFLQLAKPKALEFRQLSINQILKEMIPVIEPMALLNNVQIQLNTAKILPLTNMDPGQLKQVVLNLCQNALEAMQEGGLMTIQTSFLPQESQVCLSINDTGSGISEDKLKNIGVPFYTTKAEGTGLGLSICFTIVDKHKGRIEVRSQEGSGTTFLVFLPVIAKMQ